MKVITTVLLLLSCPAFIFSQGQLELKRQKFRLNPEMEKYEYIRFWGQNLEPILSTDPLAAEEFRKYKIGKSVVAVSLGTYTIGVFSLLFAIGTSDQTGARIGPNVDDNKEWMVPFGGISIFTGIVGMVSSGIYSRVKLKKAIHLYNLSGDSGYYYEYQPNWKLKADQNSIGLQIQFTF